MLAGAADDRAARVTRASVFGERIGIRRSLQRRQHAFARRHDEAGPAQATRDDVHRAETDPGVFGGPVDVSTVNRATLEAWLRNPPAMKPMYAKGGRGMPNLGLTEAQIDQLVAYLAAGTDGTRNGVVGQPLVKPLPLSEAGKTVMISTPGGDRTTVKPLVDERGATVTAEPFT